MALRLLSDILLFMLSGASVLEDLYLGMFPIKDEHRRG